jgi:antitoxin ParD1/3/4
MVRCAMQIKLPPDLDEYVQEKLKSGEYASIEDVFIKAVRVMRNVERAIPGAQDDLRREIDIGLKDVEEGRVAEWNLEEMQEELRRGFEQRVRGRKAS